MSLTTEFATIAIAQVQAAYSCTELEAITRLQGAAAADGDERSLEVLCAIKSKLIEAAHPVTTEVKAAALAARIVRYCQEHALGLDGMVAELSAGMPLDADRAKRLTTYCDQVQCLTLGGLVDEVWELRNEFHGAADSNEAVEAARTERAERLTQKPAPIDWAFVDSIDPEHQAQLELAMRMRSLLDMRADFKARGKLVLLGKTNALIDGLCEAAEADQQAAQCNSEATEAPVMNAFRNLYKIRDESNKVVAFVTAGNADGARGKYHGAGGQAEVVTAEQVSHGNHEDVCTIYS